MRLPQLILILTPIWLFACRSATTELRRPNVLLIVADDLGYSDLGCYGSEISTPYLDRLARLGVRGSSFYTGPTCSPTRGMLLSGVDNHRCGYGTMEGDWAENQQGVRGYEGHLNFDVVTFPKLLQDAGYHTSIAGKWHQAYPVHREDLWPNQRGFDRSFCLLQGGAGHFSDKQRMFSFYEKTLYVEDGSYVDDLPADFYSSHFYAGQVIDYIREAQAEGKPFFSFLSFTAPHWPLQVPDPYLDLYAGKYDEGYEVTAAARFDQAQAQGVLPADCPMPPLPPNVPTWQDLSPAEQRHSARTMEIYAAMVERLDASVGQVLDFLRSIGELDQTMVIFMADNGAEGNNVLAIGDTEAFVATHYDNSEENLGRPNSYLFTGPGWAHVSSLPFRWYKTFASEGGVRCPLIICDPMASKDLVGQVDRSVLSVMDVAPTVLELAGVAHPDTNYDRRKIYPMDGRSWLPWLRGRQSTVRTADQALCWELYGRRAVRKGEWKALWLDPPYGQGQWSLFHLDTDWTEQVDLSVTQPAKLEELVQEWEDYRDRYGVVLPSERVAYGHETYWRQR